MHQLHIQRYKRSGAVLIQRSKNPKKHGWKCTIYFKMSNYSFSKMNLVQKYICNIGTCGSYVNSAVLFQTLCMKTKCKLTGYPLFRKLPREYNTTHRGNTKQTGTCQLYWNYSVSEKENLMFKKTDSKKKKTVIYKGSSTTNTCRDIHFCSHPHTNRHTPLQLDSIGFY